MPVAIQCPECGAGASVPDALVGKTVKCKSCQTAFPVAGPRPAARPMAARPVAARPAVDDEDDDRPARRSRPAVEDGEDEADERPARRGSAAPKAKSKLPLILGGLLGALLLVGGTAGVMFAVLGGGDKPVDPAPQVVTPNRDREVAKDTPKAPEEQPKATQTASTPGTTAPSTAADKPTPALPAQSPSGPPLATPLAPRKAPAGADAPADTGLPAMNKVMTPAELARVERAAVYIEIEMPGGIASGSGWFGVEENLIFTNAHVLNMLAPNATKPRKLTVWIHPGTPQEQMIEHAKLDILCADRFADLAVIKVLGVPNLPTPLKLRPSLTMRKTEPMTVIGFPNGRAYTVGQRVPQPTFAPTAFSTARPDLDGNLYDIQIRGGGNAGNSGGHVVDSNGDVAGVMVRVPTDPAYSSFMSFCVPTEMVNGLMGGRVGDIEYGQAYKKGGKVHVPVTVTVLDPFRRLKEVGFGGWIGDSTGKRRPAGAERTGVEPADADYQEVKFEYKWTKDKQIATGEIVYSPAPAGRVYWAQPYYTNGLTNQRYYMAGNALKLVGPPVDTEDAELIARIRTGTTRPITLSQVSAYDEFEQNEGGNLRERPLLTTRIDAAETVINHSQQTEGVVARLGVRYKSLKILGDSNGKQVDHLHSGGAPKNLVALIDTNIKLIQGFGDVRKDGEIVKTLSDVRGAVEPLRPFFDQFSVQAMQALQQSSVPLPMATVKPGHTWQGTEKTARLYSAPPLPEGGKDDDGGAALQPKGKGPKPKKLVEYAFAEVRSYTYLGTRTRNGTKEAVLKITGTIKPAAVGSGAAATGTVKGHAFIDVETGTVLECEIARDFEIDSSAEGVKKTVAGVATYKVTRGSAQAK